MKKKKNITFCSIKLFMLFLSLVPVPLYATHLLGGEITWECIKSGPDIGKFRFKMLLYRDCGSGNATIGTGNQTLTVHNNPNLSSIVMYYQYSMDISPGVGGNCNPNIVCNGVSSGQGAIEEYYYESAPITLTGTPPANGWVFTWTSCCRPTTITNINNPGSQGYTLRAIMYPYNNQNVNPCFDSSPSFAEKPRTIICPGYLFQYNHNATDPELDSLRYAWAEAYGDLFGAWNPPVNPSVVPYVFPYTYTSPTPGNPTINSNTGEIIINNTNTQGSFATCIKVTAYKCGIKVAEIFRDIPIIYGNCTGSNNNPPNLFVNANPVPIGTQLADTVEVGDFISFNLSSLDFDLNQGGIPQIICVEPSGPQLGAGLTDPNTGCLNPPCAYFNAGSVNNGKICAQTGFTTTFNWQITCNHLGFNQQCFQQNNVYTFVFKVKDDACPIQGLNFLTYTVVIKSPPPIPSPVLRCANVLPNGDVQLTWVNPVYQDDKDSNSFYCYIIYHSTNPNGPYQVLDSVFNLGQTTYLHSGANATNAPHYYYIVTRSSCNSYQSPAADTIASMYLNVTAINNGGTANLTWNPFAIPLPSTTTGWYYIWEKTSSGTWILIDSVQTPGYQKPVTVCSDSLYYKIEVKDNIGCSSFSNIDGDLFYANSSPIAVVIDSVSVSGSNIYLSWQPSATTSVTQYAIYEFTPPASYTLLGTNNGYNNTTFTYTGGNPSTQSHSFVIVPIDSCGNIGDTSLVHNTIYLQYVKTDSCLWHNEISWNPYINWQNGTSGYIIWSSTNGSPYTPIGITTSTTYFHNNISNGNQYCYKVQAIDGSNTLSSSSNIICINVNNLKDTSVITAPDLRCISVLPNGNIQLDWIIPPDPDNTFNSYHIYYSPNAGGPYTKIDSIFSYTTTSYVHTNVNGNNASYYYYINSRSGCNGYTYALYPSDTLKSMRLTATVTGGTTANLTWNSIHTPKLPTTNVLYDIYLDIPINTGFNLIGNTTYGNEAYTNIQHYCNESGIYVVEIADQSGCTSRSSQDTVLFKDITPPTMQYFDSVSVNPLTGLAHMGWTSNTSSDCIGYFIIKPLGGGTFQIIDTVFGNTNTYYEYLLSQASSQPEYYAIAAFDSCWNYVNNQFNIHRTIYLSATFDKCNGAITLRWNRYVGFSGTLYKIYVSENGNPPVLLTTTSDSSFVHTNLSNNTLYTYWIVANGLNPIGNTATSMSNIIQVNAEFISKPQYLYLYYVTVWDSSSARLTFFGDTAADLQHYEIFRSVNNNIAYVPVATLPFNSADPQVTYIDNEVNPNENSYYYKISAVDICGNKVLTSNIGRTILLTVGVDAPQFSAYLKWNSYEDWQAQVKEYRVFRIIDGMPSPDPVVILPPSDSLYYIDDISTLTQGNGNLCYQIEAVENTPTFQNKPGAHSLSNVACVQLHPVFWIPNSFVPGSIHNPIFKPILVFTDINHYTFRIFDRWGELIYETHDIQAGWDGTTPRGPASMGVYVWTVSFTGADGSEYTERGSVTLIR